jgi:hypothetical protein
MADTPKKEVSAETRAKLSEAMKARWARERVQRAQRAERLTGRSLLSLYRAAYELTGDDEELKAIMVDGVTGETLASALDAETSAGTNLQHNARQRLTARIQEALRSNANDVEG